MTSPARWSPAARCLAAGALSGLLMAVALPAIDVPMVAWIALVPWFWELAKGPTVRQGFLSGFSYGLFLHLFSCAFLWTVLTRHAGMGPALASASFVVAALAGLPFQVLIGAFGAWSCRRHGAVGLLGLAVLLPASDAIRARMTTGFPWAFPGMSQADHPAVLAVAELGGVHAVSLVIFLVNACWVACLRAHRVTEGRTVSLRVGMAAAAITLVLLTFGVVVSRDHSQAEVVAWRIGTESDPLAEPREGRAAWSSPPDSRRDERLRAALVQAALPGEVSLGPSRGSSLSLQLDLSRRALGAGAELLVWSESAYPGTIGSNPRPLRILRKLLADSPAGAEAVIGALVEVDGSGRRLHNSVLLLDRTGMLGRHDKDYLVPFGEYLPAPWLFFWVEQRITGAVGTRMVRGGPPGTMQGARVRLGATVCYEAVVPQMTASLARQGAQLLINVSNDGWYHGSTAAEQHLRFSRVRAVETQRFVLRSAHSGITAVIDPRGRILGRLEEGERGVLLVDMPTEVRDTLYSRVGDLPLALLSLASVLMLTWWRRSSVETPSATEGEPGEPVSDGLA